MTLRLLKLPGSLFQKDSSTSTQLINFLTAVINDGYSSNLKYNVITSSRIKNEAMFINDLGFYNPENFILVLIKSPGLSGDEVLKVLNTDLLSIEEQIQGYTFDGISKDQIVGTIGIKIVDVSESEGSGLGDRDSLWELTGFVSNSKGVGKYLINKVSSLAKDFNQSAILASVIFEHNLVQYYQQYGFEEYGERSLQTVNEEGLVVGGSLEEGIYANQDFHVAFLRKNLRL